jgi:hypothetical protein
MCRSSRAARINLLLRGNVTLKTSRRQPWNTFRTWMGNSNHPCHSFNMIVRLHLNCQTDLVCLPGERTQILYIHRISRICFHPVESDNDSKSKSIAYTETWFNGKYDLDKPNNSNQDWKSDVECDLEPDNATEDSETPEKWEVIAPPKLPRLIRPTCRS